jgi:multidrug efflux pump subunit AcrA (membrane-fusion protein)
MTHVGKILVLVIMAVSLVFLGTSTVVFMTSKNWKTAAEQQKQEVAKVKKKFDEAQAVADAAKNELAAAQANAQAATKALESRIKTLEDQNKRDLDQITDVRGRLVSAQQSAKSSLDEVEAKRNETALLRQQKSAVEKQANEFQLRQAELNDRIRELERMQETATKNNTDLREQVAKFSTLLQKNGLSTDISQLKGLESPPPVEGLVKEVDSTNRRIVISIGSDDGLVQGHELYVYRTKPRPEYVCKVQIIAVDPDQAVCRVVGNTNQGKKMKEGDIVSSSVKPRF